MKVSREDLGDLNAMVTIEVSKEDYAPKVEESLKDYRKKVALKGFRKGMVPPSVVRKMYGNSVLAEELNKMIQEELSKFIKDNEIKILGDPLPQENKNDEIDLDNGSQYSFAFELGLSPQFNIGLFEEKPTFPKYQIGITDDQINEEVERMQKQMGQMTNPEGAVEEGDVLFSKLVESGKEEGERVENSTPIALDMIKDEKLLKKIMKSKLGDTLSIDITKAFDKSDHDVAHHILGLKEHNLDGVNAKFDLTIEKINRVELAEVNQELFDKAFGPGKVKTEEDMRTKIEEELTNYFDKDTEKKLEADIVKRLIDETEMSFPDEFLRKWLKATNSGELTDEQIDNEYDMFQRNLRWSLIVNRISEEKELKVEGDEIRDFVKENILKAQYGIVESEQFPAESVNNMVNEVLKGEGQLKKIYDTVLEEKLFAELRDKIEVEEKEVSLEEYRSLVKSETP